MATSPGNPTRNGIQPARNWDRVVESVRATEGMTEFLRPRDFASLTAACAGGPVVIVNVSHWRSDALIVTERGVQTVPLPDLDMDGAHRRADALARVLGRVDRADALLGKTQGKPGSGATVRIATVRLTERYERTFDAANTTITDTLEWLWTTIAAPVYDALSSLAALGPSSRVWWCPTGPLVTMPVHCAQNRDGDSLLDLCVSSYTPTLKALANARRRPKSATRDSLRRVSTLRPQSGAPGAETTVAEVRKLIQSHRSIHFHCHARQYPNHPSAGGFVFDDGMLRVRDIARLQFTGEFAGLAACQTAAGGADIPDESITLVSALHHVGFRHVVGAMWSLPNSDATTIFDELYVGLTSDDGFDPTDSARVLNRVIVNARRATPTEPFRWASLIHVGP